MALSEWKPTPDDVAALIPQRTGDPTGRAAGAFGANTVPSLSQVLDRIDKVQAEVVAAIGASVTPDLIDAAKNAVAIGVASYVELTFFPDQNLAAYGPASMLWERYISAVSTLRKGIVAGVAGAGDDAGPSYSFPSRTDNPTQYPPMTTMGERF